MFKMEGPIYRGLNWLYNFMILNLLFLVSCIPLVTIYPAIAATFGVVRSWRNQNETPIFNQYKELFLENLKQSYLVGILFTFIGLIIGADWLLLSLIPSSIRLYVTVGLLFISIIFFIAFFTIFPIMVNMVMSFKELCMNSLKVGLYKFHLSLLCILILGLWTALSLHFTFLFILYFFSVSAFIIYWVADLKFSSIAKQSKEWQQ